MNDDIWAPCLDSRSISKDNHESVWMVGLTSTSATYILLRETEIAPSIPLVGHPETCNLQMPLLNNRLEIGKWEENYVRSSMFLAFKQPDLSSAELLKEKAILDTHVLHLAEVAMKTDKSDYVLSLCKLFTFQKAMVGLVHLANSMNLSSLASKIQDEMEKQFPPSGQDDLKPNQTIQTLIETQEPRRENESQSEGESERDEIEEETVQDTSRSNPSMEESDHEESIKESSKDEDEIRPVLKKSKIETQKKNKFSVTSREKQRSGTGLDFLAHLNKESASQVGNKTETRNKTKKEPTKKEPKKKESTKKESTKNSKNKASLPANQRTLKDIF